MARVPTSKRFDGRLYKQFFVTNSKGSANGTAKDLRSGGHRARIVSFPSLSLYAVYWRSGRSG